MLVGQCSLPCLLAGSRVRSVSRPLIRSLFKVYFFYSVYLFSLVDSFD